MQKRTVYRKSVSSPAWERRSMQYEVFRSAVLGLLEEDKEWSVRAEWQEVPAVLSCGEGSIAGSVGRTGSSGRSGGSGIESSGSSSNGNGSNGGSGSGGAGNTGHSGSGVVSGANACDDLIEDFIELEQEKGPFYEFMTISINRLYFSYMEEGWDAVRSNLEKYTRRDDRGARRNRGIDYEARLTPEGVALYRKLRELRGRIAMSKQLPPYFIFMNRSLYEMCCRQPDSMEELLELYGVGEKNSSEHGEEFLEEIRKFTGGKKRQLAKIP